MCAVIRHRFPVGVSPTRPSLIAPAGSYRSGGGGNEVAGAFETHVPFSGAASRQAVTCSEHRAGLERFNVGADPPSYRGRPPSLVRTEGPRLLIPNDPIQRSHRGNGDGMSTHGKLLQHGKPQRREARSQPDSREGQAGLPGVADRPVVPGKPGNSGGGKGPEFKEAARRGDGQGEWCKPINLPIKRTRSAGVDPRGTGNACSPCFLVREPDAGNPHVLVR